MRKISVCFILSIFLMLITSCTCSGFKKYFEKTVEISIQEDKNLIYATGTIISNDGLIITDKHVVENKNNILINYYDSPDIKYEANIINVSSNYDLALIKIDKKTSFFNKIDEEFSLGQKIYSIGNAKGYGLFLGEGIITSEYKNVIYNKEEILSIQTNIEIYDGCSGGPVFNKKGNLLGLMAFRLRDDGKYILGMSFMIPARTINEFVNEGKWVLLGEG